jgi:D-beta-D-heptose 7-phosphate kinase/D-beta-D-heptose 1-phosphate adenosyltransferase
VRLPEFSNTQVLVVGDVMLDLYWQGSASRISPEAPVPVVHIESEEARLGGAANVALNTAVLGSRTYLLGLVGDDSNANLLEALLKSNYVEHHLQRVDGGKTTTKLRVVSQNQQLIRLDFEDESIASHETISKGCFDQRLANADIVILSDYAKGALKNSSELISAAKILGKPIIIDPKGKDFMRYKNATLLTPNQAEFEQVVGSCNGNSDLEERGIKLIEELRLEAILITRGAKGMCLLDSGSSPLHLPARAQEVFDVTGAGDTVISTLGVAMAAGLSLADAVKLANTAAGIVVSRLGTGSVSYDELRRSVQQLLGNRPKGVISQDALREEIKIAKENGERIVMTNGCFDLLHLGHVSYLEKAKALGDKLIVAVNDDNSIRRLKGDDRPINSLDTRMSVLAALGCVDWVVPFSEDTPQDLICNLAPDILVKGGDYTIKQVAGSDCVEAAGGMVMIMDLVENQSTTQVINKIRNRSER